LLTALALVQLYSYVAVVLYSLIFGKVDFVIPIKLALISTIIVILARSVGDVIRGWRNRNNDLSPLGLGLVTLTFEIVSVLSLTLLAYLFILQPFSEIDLSQLPLETKGTIIIGVVSILPFSFLILYDLFNLRRKGELPKISEVE
jgi:hypothetical protein